MVELADDGIGTKLFSFVKSMISIDSCAGFEQTSKDMKNSDEGNGWLCPPPEMKRRGGSQWLMGS